MNIDFNNIDLEVIPSFKGGEKEYRVKRHQDNFNNIMKGTLVPGASIGMHKHIDTSEVIYILSGSGYTIYNGVKEEVKPGACHYCEEGATHTLVNDGTEDLVFLAIVPSHRVV